MERMDVGQVHEHFRLPGLRKPVALPQDSSVIHSLEICLVVLQFMIMRTYY